MNEPRRLREGSASDLAGKLERALLNAGTSYRGSAETRTKALAAVGLAGSAALLAGSVGAVSAASAASLSTEVGAASMGGLKTGLAMGLKLAVAKVAVTVSLASAAAVAPVGYYLWHRDDTAVAVSSTAGRMERASASVSAPIAVAPPLAEGQEQGRLPDSPTELALPAAAAAPRSTATATLTSELAALDRARAALANGKASGALLALDGYAREFPHGRLELEAEVLRIAALASDGHRPAARKRAEAFVRRHPDSVLAARVRGYLDN